MHWLSFSHSHWFTQETNGNVFMRYLLPFLSQKYFLRLSGKKKKSFQKSEQLFNYQWFEYWYFCHRDFDLLCTNSRNPPVRAELLLWELSLFAEFPRKSLSTPMGSLQSAQFRLFINLLLSLKSSLRINMKIGAGYFSFEQSLKNKRNTRKIHL